LKQGLPEYGGDNHLVQMFDFTEHWPPTIDTGWVSIEHRYDIHQLGGAHSNKLKRLDFTTLKIWDRDIYNYNWLLSPNYYTGQHSGLTAPNSINSRYNYNHEAGVATSL
jgi:hypothetical protein